MLKTNNYPSVEAVPLGRPELLLRRGTAAFQPALSSFAGVCGSGRAALYWACRGLSMPSGTRAWLPSFHCGVEVQAVLDAGFNVAFYRIGSDLTIDEEDLEYKLRSQPGVVVVIHYFGFPQPGIQHIAQLCRRLECVLIEDCAHSLFSRHQGRALGEFAPISVFSLRKTLPVFDGGALQVHTPFLAAVRQQPFMAPAGLKPVLEPYILCFKSLVRRAIGERLAGTYRRLRFKAEQDENRPPRDRPQYQTGMSRLSRALAAITEPSEAAARRRAAYAALDARLQSVPGYRKVFESMAPGASPLSLPLWVRERTSLINTLRNSGIQAYRFGSVPHQNLNRSAFPETECLRSNILCMPVHQGIKEAHIERMAAVLAPMLERNLHGRSRAVRN